MKKQLTIIYFIAGRHATPDELKEGLALEAQVRYLSAMFVNDKHSVEDCDGVCGQVPEMYKHLPDAEDVIAKHAKEMEKVYASSGDVKAPKTKRKKKKSKAKEDEVEAEKPAWTSLKDSE